MDYKRIYDDLISKRKEKPATGYTENHHIVMRSMGGSDELENLVRLTGREHWVAHLLLWKIHQNSQTAHACHMMAMRCEERGIPQIRNSRMYEKTRMVCMKIWSNNGKKRIGKSNGSYGTMWVCNIELKENKKISKDEPIPEGWVKGRNKWKKTEELLERDLERGKKEREKLERYNQLYKEFRSSGKSLNEFAKYKNRSVPGLCVLFKKHIPEYRENSVQGKVLEV